MGMEVSNVRQPAASRSCMLRLLLFAALTFAATLSFIPITNANQLATSDSLNSPVIDLNMEDVMRSLRRMKRATKLGSSSSTTGRRFTVRSDRPSRCTEQRKNLTNPSQSSSSPSSSEDLNPFRNLRSEMDLITKLTRLDHQRRNNNGNSTGKCVISADQAVHYCGFTEELTAPIIPPNQQGQCYTSQKSGREICYPTYEQLDTTCTDLAQTENEGSGPVPPPAVSHATVRSMAFVAVDDLQRLIKQYYRQNQQPIPKELNYKINPYLFARYRCDFGYELVDEVDTVFCSNREWVTALPQCRGKGACRDDNGGCSHSCISADNVTVECRCPKGMVLDADERTCIKPLPKNMCKNLQGCVCESINENQMTCTCRPSGEKCFLEKGPPRIFLHPTPPYQVEPGSNLNVTCSGVGYPFPQTSWRSNAPSDVSFDQKQDPSATFNHILLVNDLSKNAEFVCHAVNKHGVAEKPIEIVVVGPNAPSLDKVDPGRTTMEVFWHPPEQLNRDITHYTIYYTQNGLQPIKSWKHIDVNEPNRHVLIEDLRPETQYTIRVRANDNLGPGKLSNAISVKTKEAAKRPVVEIAEGEELRVSPNESFSLNCNVTRGDPTPTIVWESKGRKISNPQEGLSIAIQHKGLLEETSFLCVAENEAGKTSKRIHVIVTGPTAPEKIRADVDGNNLNIRWEEPRITNGPMQDYEVLYTTDPSLPEDQWQRARSGGATELKLPNLDELTPYTFKVKGINVNGDGLTSKDQTVTTWLKPQAPIVTIRPSDPIEESPSTKELVIECDAHGVPKPKLVWFFQDTPIEDGKDGFRVYDVSQMSVQNITNSKLIAESTTRSGTYRCEAVNKEGSDQKSLEVKIKGPGTAPLNILPSTAGDGFKVDWTEPDVKNADDITNYIIYHSKDPDKPLDEWERETVPGDKLSDIITNKDEDTEYFVRIQAVNPDGPGLISQPQSVKTGLKHIPLTVKLELIDPERVGDEELVVDPGQTIRFRCVAEGRPAPSLSYTWLPVENDDSGQEPVHIRSSPHESEKHTYVSDISQTSTFTKRYLLCQARNPEGSVDDRATFVVKKPGSPPLSIDPTIDVDNKVTIKWNPPVHPNGDLDHYKVYLSADPSKPLDQWQKFDVHNIDNPMIEFNRGELEPETPYYTVISAVNKDGEGVKSDVTQFTTVSGAPINAPSDVVSIVEPDNTVNLSWSGPTQPNGPIKSYTVYFTPVDEGLSDENYKQWNKVVIPSDQDLGSVSLDKDGHSIRPNTEYKTRVSATNDLSEGPASDPIIFTTGTGEIPPTITLSPSANPASVDPKQDYTVSCTATGLPEPYVYWVVDGQRTANPLQLSSLTKDTVVTCHAENNAGSKQEALRIEVQGPGTPPKNLVANPQPDQEIDVEWTLPDEPNGQISSYIVEYGEIPEGETAPTSWDSVTVPGTEVQTTLKGLKPKTTYTVKVKGVSDRGPGVVSDPVRAKTLPLAPAAPQETKADVHDNNTVLLEFDAVTDPDDTTKKIKDYKIVYTDQDPQADDAVWREMTWTAPDDSPTVQVPIDGDHFRPNVKYHAKIIPKGEIEGTASDPILFETGDGVIAPDQPTFNVDAPDNTIRVTAGTDYAVTCSSEGHPVPKIRWVNENGETISDGATLRVSDIRVTQKAKCIAENIGGAAEEDFTIYVAGPGNAPEIQQLHAHKPRTIEVKFTPPTIPNGQITRYIIYYTPLDDQDPHKQVGQIPTKPTVEWYTHHVTGENLNEGEKSTTIKDYLTPDTAYAILIQAVNDDGPGPYSNQHTIRTMSRAQEGPPTDLRVEPIDQRSVEVDWKAPENVEEDPIGYELYYVPANKEIEIDEFESLPKWTKVGIDSGASISHVLQNELEPNTEYVFKIRAIYPSGPGVFSEPCISKTLPEGTAPVISVSSGGEGVSGTTKIDLLPGSSINIFCNATGSPQPSVKWIRVGSIAIDPSTVKAEEISTRWSLKVVNITANTTFNCLAKNSLGVANWSIVLDIIEDLPENWRNDLIKAKVEGDDVLLAFDNKISRHLKDPNEWKLHYTDNPSKPKSEWSEIDSDGRSLENIKLPNAELGKARYIILTDPNTGIQTPIFTVVAPSPAKITNLGANINDEVVVDFKPAVGSSNVKNYEIRYWPSSDSGNVKSQNVDPTSLSGNVITDLNPDTDYQVQVVTTFEDGELLPGAISMVRTPPEDLHCDCSHACRLDKDSEGKSRIVCYCPTGYELGDDGKTCTKLPGTEHEQIVVEVTPDTVTESSQATGFTNVDGSVLPTDELGHPVETAEDETPEPYPTDSLGREIKPIVRVDGSRLPTDDDGNTLNQQGKLVEYDDQNRPVGPDNQILPKNGRGDWLYPELDQYGHALPTDKNGLPVYPILDSNDRLLNTNSAGQRVDKQGVPIPTSIYGKPIGPDSSPLPVDPQGNYRWHDELDDITDEPFATDDTGRIIHPIVDKTGELLPTSETGRHIDRNDVEIPLNDQGIPIDPQTGNVLSKNSRNQYIFEEKPDAESHKETDHTTRPDDQMQGVTLPTDRTTTQLPTTEEPTTTTERERETLPTDEVTPSETRVDEHPETTIRPTTSSGYPIVLVDPDANPLPTSHDGQYLKPDGSPVPTNVDGQYVDVHGSLLPVDPYGRVVIWPTENTHVGQTLPTDPSGKVVHQIVGSDGQLLATDSTGRHIDAQNEPIPLDDYNRPLNKHTNEVLPTNSYGQYIAEAEILPTLQDGRPVVVSKADETPEVTLPTDQTGKQLHPVFYPDNTPLSIDPNTGNYIKKNGEPIASDDQGRPLDSKGDLLPQEDGKYIFKDPMPTTSSGQYITVVGPDGILFDKNKEGQFVKPDGSPVPVNEKTQYTDKDGNILPVDQFGRVVLWPEDDVQTAKTLPTDDTGHEIRPIVGSDGQLLPKDPNTGRHTNYHNEPIPLDDFGRPLDSSGKILPTNEYQQFVHNKIAVLPTSQSGRPIVVVGPDDIPLSTDSVGHYLQSDGSPVPTNQDQQFVGPDSSVLPTTYHGQVVWPEKQTTNGGVPLSTDETGKQIFPVVRPDGSLLPTDPSTGRFVDDRGETIQLDEFNRPLNPEGYPLPTNLHHQYIYPEPEKHQTIVVDPEGHPLQKDSQGNFLKPDGSLIQKDSKDNYIGPDNQPLEKNEQGNYIYSDQPKTLPTDSNGKFIYPIVREDNTLLPTSATTGRHVSDSGQEIAVNDYGQPIDQFGNVLPVNDKNQFIYKTSAEIRPTDSRTGRPVTVVDIDNQPLPTNADGLFLGPDSSPLPTNSRNEYIDHDGTPYQVSDQGVVVVSPDVGLITAKTLPTDRTNKVIMPVIDEHGQLRPTDETGLYLDHNGSPLEIDEYGRPHYPDGELLMTDSDGNYVYEDKRKKVSKFCFIDGYIELIIVLDTSANVKILDHRLMKETVKTFLKENFDLRENRVRVGIVKFGSEVEVPVALGDYHNGAELLNRLGEARRLRGSPRLGEALRDTVSEFSISGSPNARKVVLVIKNGQADDNFVLPSEMLRDQIKAEVFVISVGEDSDDNLQIVGSGNSDRVKHFKNWRVIEPDDLGPIADSICSAIPEDERKPSNAIWPTRASRPLPPRRECSSIEYELDTVVILDSSKFTDDEFKTTLEAVGTLIDESFDLSPDVVRVGFIVFSDKVSVPVALGHYEDKIEMLQKIEESERLDGQAVAIKGLDAAEEQFRLHGRRGVARVVVLITNGNFRGNAAVRAKELRDREDIQLFVLAINPTQTRLSSLARLVGVEYANERLLKIQKIDDISNELNTIRTSLCGHITHKPITSNEIHTTDTHSTSKREVTYGPISVTKGLSPPPSLCQPNGQKMSVNIIVDSNGGTSDKSTLDEIRKTVDSYFNEYQSKFPDSSHQPNINLINVNSESKSILQILPNIPLAEFKDKMDLSMDLARKENERVNEVACNH